MYRRFSSLLPRRMIESMRERLAYVSIDVNERKFLGFLFIYSLALSLGIAINLALFLEFNFFLSFGLLIVMFIGGTYLWLSIAAESKGKYVERILPDALQLIASNIKSGLTAERALFVSARPEFGPLEKELKRASTKIMSGERVEDALNELPRRIKSKTLERTVWLISKGITSGGQMADLLMQLSDDIRDEHEVDDEVNANVSVYVLLIFFSTAIGAPMLFGISTFIVEILSKHMSTLGEIPTNVNLGIAGQFIGGGMGTLSPEFVLLFAYIALAVSCVFAGLTIGVINTGREKQGVKFIPLLIVVSFAIFLIIRAMLMGYFGSLLV